MLKTKGAIPKETSGATKQESKQAVRAMCGDMDVLSDRLQSRPTSASFSICVWTWSRFQMTLPSITLTSLLSWLFFSGAVVVAVVCSFTLGEAWHIHIIWPVPKPGFWSPSDGDHNFQWSLFWMPRKIPTRRAEWREGWDKAGGSKGLQDRVSS